MTFIAVDNYVGKLRMLIWPVSASAATGVGAGRCYVDGNRTAAPSMRRMGIWWRTIGAISSPGVILRVYAEGRRCAAARGLLRAGKREPIPWTHSQTRPPHSSGRRSMFAQRRCRTLTGGDGVVELSPIRSAAPPHSTPLLARELAYQLMFGADHRNTGAGKTCRSEQKTSPVLEGLFENRQFLPWRGDMLAMLHPLQDS